VVLAEPSAFVEQDIVVQDMAVEVVPHNQPAWVLHHRVPQEDKQEDQLQEDKQGPSYQVGHHKLEVGNQVAEHHKVLEVVAQNQAVQSSRVEVVHSRVVRLHH